LNFKNLLNKLKITTFFVLLFQVCGTSSFAVGTFSLSRFGNLINLTSSGVRFANRLKQINNMSESKNPENAASKKILLSQAREAVRGCDGCNIAGDVLIDLCETNKDSEGLRLFKNCLENLIRAARLEARYSREGKVKNKVRLLTKSEKKIWLLLSFGEFAFSNSNLHQFGISKSLSTQTSIAYFSKLICEIGLESYEYGAISKDEMILYGSEFFVKAGGAAYEIFWYGQPGPNDYASRDRFEDEWHDAMPDFAQCKKCNEWAFEFKCPKDSSHKVGCANCLRSKSCMNIYAFVCPECKSPIKEVPDDKSDDSDAEPSLDDQQNLRRVERIFINVCEKERPKITFGKCIICMSGKNEPLISCPASKHIHNIGCLSCAKSHLIDNYNRDCPTCRQDLWNIKLALRSVN
jgi:hypothetical protein